MTTVKRGGHGFAFPEKQIDELLEALAKGNTLTSICTDPKMPSVRKVYEWVEGKKDFAARFHDARAKGVHALVEQCLEIAAEPVEKDDSVKVADKRLRIDTRLRLAGKWLPSLYGDKLEVNSKTEVTHRHDLSGYSANELDALEKLVAKGSEPGRDQGGTISEKPGSIH